MIIAPMIILAVLILSGIILPPIPGMIQMGRVFPLMIHLVAK